MYLASRNMAFVSLRSRLRILWMATAALVFLTRSSAAPSFGHTDEALMYLAKYGYLSPSLRNSSSAHLDVRSWSRAIAKFQSFFGLNVTGELDEETTKVMSLPRCGVRDEVDSEESRVKRYAVEGTIWFVKDLTYKISKYTLKLDRTEVDAEIAKAFSVWSDYTDLTFTQKRSGKVDIEISFVEGDHGDEKPFQGRFGALAHASLPSWFIDTSFVHFDDAEPWTVNSSEGINLFQVAAHELGHSLGLQHSNVPSAVMTPTYSEYDPNFHLDQDDIQGIQALYGPKTQTGGGSGIPVPSLPRTIPPTEDWALGGDPNFDTIFNSANGSTFIFKGEHSWRLTKDGVDDPQLIALAWPGLPDNIDAAFTYNEKMYFFKGSKYWKYVGNKIDGVYPQKICKGFPGIPDNLDAAMVWSGNGRIYFFKGSKFWRFDSTRNPPVKASYPKPLSYWKGIPDHIDAALLHSNGHTYFFKAGSYWRFNDSTFSVDLGFPSFPRSTASWWLGNRGTEKADARFPFHDDYNIL